MKIVLSMALAFFLVACSDSKEQTKEVKAPAAEVEKVAEVKVQEPAEPEVKEIVEEEVKAVVEPVAAEVVEEVKEVKAEAVKVVEEVKTVAETKVAEVKTPATSAIDGSQLFVKCAACHGKNAEKSAMGKSQVIKGWSQDKVMTALHGYKEGTYGGTMKGLMKSQIANFSEDELKALAKHISKL